MAKEKSNKPLRITKSLIIAALAYDCPWRDGGNVIYRCMNGDPPTNCTPHLCSHCTHIFRTMSKIASGEIDFDANLKVR